MLRTADAGRGENGRRLLARALFGGDISDHAFVPRSTSEREKFHPKGRDTGYVLTMGGKSVYVAEPSLPNSYLTFHTIRVMEYAGTWISVEGATDSTWAMRIVGSANALHCREEPTGALP